MLRCGKYVMDVNGQSIIAREERGFIKLLFASDSDVLLGAQMMCPRATDMIGEMADVYKRQVHPYGKKRKPDGDYDAGRDNRSQKSFPVSGA